MNPTAIAGFLIVDFSIDLSTGQGIFKQNFPSFENRIWVDFPLLAAGWIRVILIINDFFIL